MTVYRPASNPRTGSGIRYRPLQPSTELIPAGHRQKRGHRRTTVDILVSKDEAATLRDGTTIYYDVHRPADASGPVPAIVCWGPYGKGGTGSKMLNGLAAKFGVARSVTSGLECFESVDPGYWCAHGYAVVQVDPRGVMNSAGDIRMQGADEGEDGHDLIEAVAEQSWCTGKVGMAGNSWLAILQWQIAATNPPHLAAIAPWEGLNDFYDQTIMRGGIPNLAFADTVRDSLGGFGRVEDPVAMAVSHPHKNEYWQAKAADIESITAPAYVVASYTNQLHAEGTLDAWSRLQGPKWLRINNTHEWTDFYDPDNVDDLRRFFDHYLGGLDNGWESTAPVRMSVLDPGGKDTVGRAVESFPPAGTTNELLYLDASRATLDKTPGHVSQTRYALREDKPNECVFRHRFDQDVELIGSASLTAWFEVQGGDDADIYAYLRKRDVDGRRQVHQMVFPPIPGRRTVLRRLHLRGNTTFGFAFYDGPEAMLRLSWRDVIASGHQHRDVKPLTAGKIVEATLSFWTTGMRWRASETMELVISSRRLRSTELPGLTPMPAQTAQAVVVHTGGDHPSRLTLPLLRTAAVPAR